MTDTSKAGLCWPNRTDEGVLSSTGTWEADFPLTNLQTYLLHERARTSDGTTTQITLTIPPRLITAGSLESHNLTNTATWRWRYYSDAAKTTLVYDSGVIDAFDVDDDDQGILPPSSYHVADAEYTVEAIVIDIVDDDNGDGFVQFGRLFAGPMFQAEINIVNGYTSGGVDVTEVQIAVDGTTAFYDVKTPRRTETMTFPALTREEAYLRIRKMQLGAGLKGEILFFKDLLANSTARWTTFLATQQEINPISQPFYNRHAVGLSLIEKR